MVHQEKPISSFSIVRESRCTQLMNGLHMLRIFERNIQPTTHIRRMDNYRIRRETLQFRRDQVSDSSHSKIKTLFFLKHSLFLPLGACLRRQDPGLDHLALSTSPRFYAGFLDQRLFRLCEVRQISTNSSHVSSMIVRPVYSTGNNIC